MSERSDKPLILVPAPTRVESEAGSGPERRRALRYPFTAAAEIVDLSSQTRVSGRSSDLGLGGCYIDILSPLRVGTAVCVRLEHDQHVFEAMATVSYAHASMGMGLQFTHIKTDHQAVLLAWVAELSGGRLPELGVAVAGAESGTSSTDLKLQQLLNELINLMVRKKVIDEGEADTLLRQIFR